MKRRHLRPGQKLLLVLSSYGYSDFFTMGRTRRRVQVPAGWVLHLTNLSEWVQKVLALPQQSVAYSGLIPKRGRFLIVEGQEVPLGRTGLDAFEEPMETEIEVTVIGRDRTDASIGWA